MSAPTETSPPDELALPHFEDALWAELADLLQAHEARPAPHRHRHRGRRIGLLAAASVAVAAVIAAAVAFCAAPGADPPQASATVVARIHRATQAAAGNMILHVTSHDAVQGRTDSWYDPVTAAWRVRTADPPGHVLTDFGPPTPPRVDDPPVPGIQRTSAACDPLTLFLPGRDLQPHLCDRSVVSPRRPSARRVVSYCARSYAQSDDPAVWFSGMPVLTAYGFGDSWEVAGIRTVDGRRLILLRAANTKMLVDPDSFLPMRVTVLQMPPDPYVSVTMTYEWLTRTPKHLARLSSPIPDGFRRTARATYCDQPDGTYVYEGA